MATNSQTKSLQPGNYVSIRDPKATDSGDGHMPTVRGYSCGTVFKVHNDNVYITVELPNGVRQKLPRGRCKLLKDEKEYFLHMLKGSKYQ